MKKAVLTKIFFCQIFFATFLFPSVTKAAWTYTLASANPAVPAANICPGTSKVPIYSITITRTGSGTGTATMTGMNFTTAGTYAAASITRFELYSNTTNNLATALLRGTVNPAGAPGLQTFTGFSSVLLSTTPYYFWITMDVAASPTAGNTISVNAMTWSNMTFSGGLFSTCSGCTFAGGTQTIIGITAQPTAVPSSLCAGGTTVISIGTTAGPSWTYQWQSSAAAGGPYANVVDGTPAGVNYSNENTASMTVANLTANRYFRCIVGGPCALTTSNVLVTVNASVAPPVLTIEAFDIIGTSYGSNNPTICQFQYVDFWIPGFFENTEPKTFKWKKNGTIESTQTATNPGSIIWNSSSLANGDVVTLTAVFTAPPPCYSPDSVTSQAITFTVTPNQPPLINVTNNSLNDTICRGSTIIFTGNVSEAGTPTYEWYLDGPTLVGTSSTYTTLATLLSGNHYVYCKITSGEPCDSQDPVFNPEVTSDTAFFYVDPCSYYVPVSGVLGTHYTCGSPFYDSQNDLSVPYAPNVDGKTTFCPATAGDYITISLSQLRLGSGDTLRIYNSSTTPGDITTYPVPLVTYFGPTTTTPACNSATIANVSSGCLTAWFKSNATSQDSGWKSTITCSPTPSAGPLAGSTCANSTVISALPYAVVGHTTLCYGNDYATTTCLSGNNAEDHVYEYTATGPECTSITMSGTTGNPTLAVYLGCPAAGTCITPTPMVGNSTAQITFPSAGTYYIIVDGTSGSSNYNLSILSFGIAPDNDLPCNAQYVDLSVNVNGNNTCTGAASEPGNPSCWTGGAINTNWFSFIAPASGSVRIRATGGSIGSTQIALYSGTCSSLTLVACNQNGPSCAGSIPTTSSEIAWTGLTPSATYFVRVDGTNSQTGNYSLIVVDQTGPQPYADGQDCLTPMTVCNSNFTVGNPGFLWNGWVCDYPSANGTCMSAGERSSAWYVINISNAGNFTFALSPLGNTDYDWVLFDITSLGPDPASRLIAACAQINATNLTSWVRCNWSAPQASACGTTYMTGMCTAAGLPATAGAGGPSFSSAYPVIAGKTLLLNLSNFTQNATGFSIDFNNFSNTSPITYSNPPSVLYWTGGANNTDWFNPVNWGNCGPPNCNTTAVITTGSSFMPVINANGAVCRDLDIKATASVTINAGIQLDICRHYTNNGSLIAAVNSTVRVMGTAAQYFDGNMIGSSAFGNLWMNKSSNHMTILDHARVAGNLTLGAVNGGKIITGTKILYSINSSPGSVTSGGPGSYVEGFLRRNLSGSAGTYYWPVGTLAKGFQLAAIDFYGTHSIGNILGFFTGTAIPIQPGPIGPECPTYDYSTMAPLNNGYWTMTANANASSANYKMTLFNLPGSYTNSAGAAAWTVLKAATAAGPWTLSGNCIASTANATARDNMNGFSVFTSGQSGPAGPIPVELLTLTATAISTGVSVDWETASEINNHHFDIERSHDGVNFEKIGEMAGAGNSTVNKSYSSIDPSPYEGINYYRLKQVDFDGTYEYSDRVFVTVKPDAGLVSVFPDQASAQIGCELNADGAGPVELQILDVLGKVYSTEIREVKAGYNRLEDLSVENLASGVYFIKVKGLRSEIVPLSQIKFVLPLPADARILHPSMQK